MSVSDWINKTSMTSLKEAVMLGLWVIGSLALTGVCARLLLANAGDFFRHAPIAPSPDKFTESITVYLAMADSYVNNKTSTGFNLALALLAAWGYGKTMNVVQHGKDRDTSQEKIRAEGEARASVERAKTEGAALVNGHTTREREAMPVVAKTVNVEAERAVVQPSE